MFPHRGVIVPSSPLEQFQDWVDTLDPMACLLSGVAVLLIFMLYVAFTTEEER